GATVLPNVLVTTGMSNAVGLANGNEYGDYIGLSFTNGRYHIAWADNNRLLPGNPDIPSIRALQPGLDIATATVTLTSGGVSTGTGFNLPPDIFEPNNSPAAATNFGLLQFPQEFGALTINRLADGTPDQDWFTFQAGQTGIFTATIGY